MHTSVLYSIATMLNKTQREEQTANDPSRFLGLKVIPYRCRTLTEGQKNSYSNHQPHISRTNQDCGLRAHTCVCSWACFQRTEATAAVRDFQPVQVSIAVCCRQDLSANDQAVHCLGLSGLF